MVSKITQSLVSPLLLGATLIGCRSTLIERTDREVYSVIAERQRTALGSTSDVRLGRESGQVPRSSGMYSFNPRPVEPELPEAFRAKPTPQSGGQSPPQEASPPAPEADRAGDGQPTAESTAVDETELSESIFTPQQRDRLTILGLSDALSYAARHARELQDAKEALYFAALDLTLERHLWTPQFVASVRGEFADFGQVRDFDRAMTAVSDFALTQRLPYGGEVTARVVSSLMRDLGVHTTSGESGDVILEANIPLFRGAGRVAYESRYVAERELIYAVRTYERFRRAFLVDVAGEYFALQQRRSQIKNTYKGYVGLRIDVVKQDFISRVGQSRTIFDVSRAKSSLRRSESALVGAKERYESALDRFKISLGMPVDSLLDVMDQDLDEDARALDDLLAEVSPDEAVDVALSFRLDLLNSADRVDDARRGVHIARNAILPDLDANGSITIDTDPDRLNSARYNLERTTWRATLGLRIDDRKTERNAYRASLVRTRRAERDHDRTVDVVRADVRRALRRITVQQKLRAIQETQVEENELRLEAARAQFDLGQISNRDVVDAEDALLTARNDLASAISSYRSAILEFRRDTGTLRVTDDGQWQSSPSGTGNPGDVPVGP